jgi:hypothetical protein
MLRTAAGTGWASKIIQQFWQMIYHLWLNLNEVLHKRGEIDAISGSTLLDIGIEREYDMGCQPKIFQLQYINGLICQ